MNKVLSYRPDIDGLRAIAILSVVAFHTSNKLLPGGFIGVDIFFIISGYLISGIIFRELAIKQFSFKEFYIRRIKRIFPALLLVLICVALYSWYVLLPDEFIALGKHLTAGSLFVSNFLLWQESGYFDAAAELKPLLHLWSLGIEEQFYIIWPLLLVFFWRLRFNFFILLFAGIALSFTLNINYVHRHPILVFYLPITRFWELLLGSSLAYYETHRKLYSHTAINHWLDKASLSLATQKIINNSQAILGLALIMIALFALNHEKAFPGWWALLPTLGALLLISAGNKAWINKNILAHPILVYIGLISFPLYLWHWPLLTFVRIIETQPPSVLVRVIAIALAFVLAWLTYLFIEKPIRHARHPKSRHRIILILIMINLAVAILGYSAYKTYLITHFDSPVVSNIEQAIGDWEYPGSAIYKANLNGYKLTGSGTKTVLFIGDSHAEHYWPRFEKLTTTQRTTTKNIAFTTYGGCLPFPHVNINGKQCDTFLANALNYAKQPEIDTVVFSAFWDGSYFNGLYFLSNVQGYNAIEWDNSNGAKAFQGFTDSIKELIQQHKKVYIVLSNPADPNFDPKHMMKRSYLGGFTLQFHDPSRQEFVKRTHNITTKLRSIAQETGAIVIDPVPYLCNDITCPSLTPDGKPHYKDDHHIRPFFARDYITYLDTIAHR